MRNYSILLIVSIVLLTSCNPDDGPPPLTPDLVIEVTGFDLDNNGNSSDLRVDFEITDNLNVTEYRVMIVPSGISNSFTLDVALSISEERYVRILPKPFETDYTINRLPSTLPDVNGALIINGEEYVVAILTEGLLGNFQLSEFSRPFTLLDQGIYVGYYEGTGCCLRVEEEHNIIILKGPLTGSGVFYQGVMESIFTPFMGNISFNVEDDIISNCVVSDGLLGDFLANFDPGSGIVINDLLMEITFIGLKKCKT